MAEVINKEVKESCIISIEDWQMQCCGTPFKIGDKIDWLLHEYGKPSEDTGNPVEYYYEHHSSEWKELFRIEGFVTGIKALFYKYELHPSSDGNPAMIKHPIFMKAVVVECADGWEKDIDGLEFGEYEVILQNCVIRPAKKSEVTFS